MDRVRETQRLVEALNMSPNDEGAWESLLHLLRRSHDFGWLERIRPSPFISQGFIRSYPEPEKLRFEYHHPDGVASDLKPVVLREVLRASNAPLYLTFPVRLRMAWSSRRGFLWAADCLEQTLPVLQSSENRARGSEGAGDLYHLYRGTLERMRKIATRRHIDPDDLRSMASPFRQVLQEGEQLAEDRRSLSLRWGNDPYRRARDSASGPGREGNLTSEGRVLVLSRAMLRALQGRVGDTMANIFEAMPEGVTEHERTFQTNRLLAYLGHQRPPEINP